MSDDTNDYKESVRAATTANIALSGLLTIDGVVTVRDDRVLVKNQTDARQNGIYDVRATAWKRSSDFRDHDANSGAMTYVEEGATNRKKLYTMTNTEPVRIDVSNIVFENVVGAKGDTGAAGAAGVKGDKGDKGDTGADGTNGVSPSTTQSISGQWTFTAYPVKAERAANTDHVFEAKIAGEAQPRISVRADGRIDIGDGTNPPDSIIYRSGVNQFRIASGLLVAGPLTAEDSSEIAGVLKTDSGRQIHRTHVAADIAIDETNHYLSVDSSGAAVTITAPVTPVVGQVVEVSDYTGSAGTHNITFDGNGHNVRGAATHVISAAYGYARYVYDNAWQLSGVSA